MGIVRLCLPIVPILLFSQERISKVKNDTGIILYSAHMELVVDPLLTKSTMADDEKRVDLQLTRQRHLNPIRLVIDYPDPSLLTSTNTLWRISWCKIPSLENDGLQYFHTTVKECWFVNYWKWIETGYKWRLSAYSIYIQWGCNGSGVYGGVCECVRVCMCMCVLSCVK